MLRITLVPRLPLSSPGPQGTIAGACPCLNTLARVSKDPAGLRQDGDGRAGSVGPSRPAGQEEDGGGGPGGGREDLLDPNPKAAGLVGPRLSYALPWGHRYWIGSIYNPKQLANGHDPLTWSIFSAPSRARPASPTPPLGIQGWWMPAGCCCQSRGPR